MAIPTITKIEAIPQIWGYKQSWLRDAWILPPKNYNGDTPGNFFPGIIDNGTDSHNLSGGLLNTYLDETDAVKITFFERRRQHHLSHLQLT